MSEKKFTGRHFLIIMVSAFSVIILVNLVMAFQANRTFPGLEVPNSYTASQKFEKERSAQNTLGWQADLTYADGKLLLSVQDKKGTPIFPDIEKAVIGRVTHVLEDQSVTFLPDGNKLGADIFLQKGRWKLWLEMRASDDTLFRQGFFLMVNNT